jgi:L-ribulose-5-phosphate 3-epimerase
MSESFTDRLGVCSWSLQVNSARELADAVGQTGVTAVQIALDPFREDPDAWKDAPAVFGDAGISLLSGMFGCVGEDYSTLDAIRITGGVVPDETWPVTWTNAQSAADKAAELGLKLVTFHAGFLPDSHDDPTFEKLRERIV